jgi:hypothetical protein
MLTFITVVVQVYEVWLPIARKRRGVNSVSMVLTRDVASSSCQVQCWNVMCSIAVLELDCASACSQCEQLMP